MNEREALQLALDALEANLANWNAKIKAIPIIKQALAQPEPEPLAWFRYETFYEYRNQLARCTKDCIGAFPVYTSPPKREWHGLTEIEVDECYKLVMYDMNIEPSRLRIYQAIEAKLKEKNT